MQNSGAQMAHESKINKSSEGTEGPSSQRVEMPTQAIFVVGSFHKVRPLPGKTRLFKQ